MKLRLLLIGTVAHITVLPLSNGQVRLTNLINAHHGNLEAYRNGYWGTVCGIGFGKVEADVACFELGFDFYQSRQYGYDSNSTIQGTNFNCLGSESKLLDCSFDTNTSDCDNKEDAVIIECYDDGSPSQANDYVLGSRPAEMAHCPEDDGISRDRLIALLLGVLVACLVLHIVVRECWRRKEYRTDNRTEHTSQYLTDKRNHVELAVSAAQLEFDSAETSTTCIV